jgi:hypothetical protein
LQGALAGRGRFTKSPEFRQLKNKILNLIFQNEPFGIYSERCRLIFRLGRCNFVLLNFEISPKPANTIPIIPKPII